MVMYMIMIYASAIHLTKLVVDREFRVVLVNDFFCLQNFLVCLLVVDYVDYVKTPRILCRLNLNPLNYLLFNTF